MFEFTMSAHPPVCPHVHVSPTLRSYYRLSFFIEFKKWTYHDFLFNSATVQTDVKNIVYSCGTQGYISMD